MHIVCSNITVVSFFLEPMSRLYPIPFTKLLPITQVCSTQGPNTSTPLLHFKYFCLLANTEISIHYLSFLTAQNAWLNKKPHIRITSNADAKPENKQLSANLLTHIHRHIYVNK